MKLSETQTKAVHAISTSDVYMRNDGSTDTKGVTAPTVASLRKAGLVVVNGAHRKWSKGRSLRRLEMSNKFDLALVK